MLKAKLIILYILIFVLLALGGFAVFQCFRESGEDLPDEYIQPDAYVDDVASGVEYDFPGLLAQNEDFVGWLNIPDTSIDFPVVQGDNNQYYLDHNFYGDYNVFGCPFLDTRTPLSGSNLVIHGHNMGNNRTEIFSPLMLYEDPDYAKAHNIIRFARPDREEGEYILFAVANINIYDESLQYIRSGFETEAERSEFLSTLQQRSLYPTEGIPDGQILILSTCNRFYGADNRLLLVAVECGKLS